MSKNSKELKVKYYGKGDFPKRKKSEKPSDISVMGYRDDSPYRSLPYIDIHTPDGTIDMSATGIPLWANGRILPPYSGIHQFDTTQVKEIPLAQKGLTVLARIDNWIDNAGKNVGKAITNSTDAILDTGIDQIPYVPTAKAFTNIFLEGRPLSAASNLLKIPGGVAADFGLNLAQDYIEALENKYLPHTTDKTLDLAHEGILTKIGLEIADKNLPGITEAPKQLGITQKDFNEYLLQNKDRILYKGVSYDTLLKELAKKYKKQKGGSLPLAQKGRQTRKLQPWEYVDKEGKIWNDMAKIPLDPQGRTKYAESLDWMKNWISQRKPQMLSLMKGHMAEMDEKYPVDAWARKYIYSPLFGKASAYKLTNEWGEDDLGKLVNQKLNKAIGNINTVQFVDDSKIAGDTYTSGLGSYSPYSHRIKFSWPGENVQVHEIGHSSKLEEESVVRSFIRRTIENDPVYKKNRDPYYHDPGEIYSRIWELRRGLNIKPNEKITKESLKKKLEKEKDRYDIDEYINIFRHLDTDTIINLLNGLVYQENTSKEEIPMAQKGIEITEWLKKKEQALNKSLGNPMARAEQEAAESAYRRGVGTDTGLDNFRHPMAGRYAAQAIEKKFPGWMQNYTPVPKIAGFLGSTALGAGHELSEPNTSADYNLWDTIREGGEDFLNNMVGAAVGVNPFMNEQEKTEYLEYLSDNNLLPDGVGYVDPKKNQGKGNLYWTKAKGGSSGWLRKYQGNRGGSETGKRPAKYKVTASDIEASDINEQSQNYYNPDDLYYSDLEYDKDKQSIAERVNLCKTTGKGCLSTANYWYNKWVAPKIGNPSSWDELTHSGVNSTEENTYDSWDVHGLDNRSVFYNRNSFKDKYSGPKAENIWKQLDLPIGAIVGYGEHGVNFQKFGEVSMNARKGLPEAGHSGRIVAFDKDTGEPWVFDSVNGLSRISENTYSPISVISADNRILGNTYSNLQKGKNAYTTAKTTPIEIQWDDFIDEDGKVVSWDEDEFKPFMQAFINNKPKWQGIIGLDDKQYNEYTKIAGALAISETEGGNDNTWRYGLPAYTLDKMGFTNSTGITQLNNDVVRKLYKKHQDKFHRYGLFMSAAGRKQSGRTGRLYNFSNPAPQDAAFITMLLLKDNKANAERLFKKGKTNNPNLTDADKQWYTWNQQGTLLKGEAQGDATMLKKFRDAYNKIKVIETIPPKLAEKKTGGSIKRFDKYQNGGPIGPQQEQEPQVARVIGQDQEGTPILRPTTGYYLPEIEISAERPDTYSNYMLDRYKDAGMLEAVTMLPIDYALSFPQAFATKLMSGKYQLPSEAMGVESFLGGLAVDMLTDPTNYIGAGLLSKGKGFVTKGKGLLKTGLKDAAQESISPSTVRAVEEIGLPAIGPQQAWSMSEKPGLHLRSTMTGSPLEKQISKSGTIDIESVKSHINKPELGGQDKYVIGKVLDEKFPGQKKIDYNEFRQAVQDELVDLEATSVQNYEHKGHGVKSLGYPESAEKNAELRQIDYEIDDILSDIKTERIINNDAGIIENLERTLEQARAKRDKIQSTLPIENEMVAFGNVQKLGKGSGKHIPEDIQAVGHTRTLVTQDEPEVMHLLEIQSDLFQDPVELKRLEKVYKNKHTSPERIQKLENSYDRNVDEWNKTIAEAEKSGARDYEIAEIKRNRDMAVRKRDLFKAEMKNLEQKRFLGKSHQERLLQESVAYAAKKGKNKVRVPTPETAAKIQGYPSRSLKDDLDKYLEQLEYMKIDSEFVKLPPDEILPIEEYGYKMLSETPVTKKEYINLINKKVEDLKKTPYKELYVKKHKPEHQSILKKYSEQPKIIKKTFGKDSKVVRDAKGNTWYEFDTPESYIQGKQEIKAFQKGGSKLPSHLPEAYQAGGHFTHSAYYPVADLLYISPEDKADEGIYAHEAFHRFQNNELDSLRLPDYYPGPLRRPQTPSSEELVGDYWNRRGVDAALMEEEYLSDPANASFRFVPYDMMYNYVYNPMMYETPWTAEGEAMEAENAFRQQQENPMPGPESYKKKGGWLKKYQNAGGINYTDYLSGAARDSSRPSGAPQGASHMSKADQRSASNAMRNRVTTSQAAKNIATGAYNKAKNMSARDWVDTGLAGVSMVGHAIPHPVAQGLAVGADYAQLALTGYDAAKAVSQGNYGKGALGASAIAEKAMGSSSNPYLKAASKVVKAVNTGNAAYKAATSSNPVLAAKNAMKVNKGVSSYVNKKGGSSTNWLKKYK